MSRKLAWQLVEERKSPAGGAVDGHNAETTLRTRGMRLLPNGKGTTVWGKDVARDVATRKHRRCRRYIKQRAKTKIDTHEYKLPTSAPSSATWPRWGYGRRSGAFNKYRLAATSWHTSDA